MFLFNQGFVVLYSAKVIFRLSPLYEWLLILWNAMCEMSAKTFFLSAKIHNVK